MKASAKATSRRSRRGVLKAFEEDFPDRTFDPEFLTLVGVDYLPQSTSGEDDLLVREYVEERYGASSGPH